MMRVIFLNLMYKALLITAYAYDNMVEVKIDQSLNLSSWTSCAKNSFRATNSSLFYRLKTTRDIVSEKSFGYSLAAVGEGFNINNAAFFPPISTTNNLWSEYESLYIIKLNTSAAANVGIPVLNPTLYFEPIYGPSFFVGGITSIFINGIRAASEVLYIQSDSKYSGQPFAVRLVDTGQILTHDSSGNELRFSPTSQSTYYNIVIP